MAFDPAEVAAETAAVNAEVEKRYTAMMRAPHRSDDTPADIMGAIRTEVIAERNAARAAEEAAAVGESEG